MAQEETANEETQVVIEGDVPSSIDLFVEKHRKSVLLGVLILLLGAFGYIFFANVSKNNQLAAGQAFSAASSIDEFDAVSSDHAGTVSAGNALLMKAELESKDGKAGEAQATLTNFVTAYADHPRYSQGIFALAILAQDAGDYALANNHLQQVLDHQPAPDIAPLALIRKGDIAYAQGDIAGARGIYQSVMPTYPGNAFFYQLQRKLNRKKIRELNATEAATQAAEAAEAAAAKLEATPTPTSTPTPAPAPATITPPAKVAPTPSKPAAKPGTAQPAAKSGAAQPEPAAEPKPKAESEAKPQATEAGDQPGN
ncbi:MAG: tetratricopeptide repeat protein, partial [Verrucomicrobiales bacterium]